MVDAFWRRRTLTKEETQCQLSRLGCQELLAFSSGNLSQFLTLNPVNTTLDILIIITKELLKRISPRPVTGSGNAF
jgi:hypothetical protein